MVQTQQQSHTLDGLSLANRIQSGGYTSQFLEVGESLFAATENVFHGHSAFAIDWGDNDSNPNNGFGTGIQTPALHREVMMSPAFKEIGIGFQSIPIPPGNGQSPGPLVVTQHFASQYRYTGTQYVSDAIVTGVVHSDSILADAFYTPGEGIANSMIQVWDTFTSTLMASGLTNSAGGFNITTPDLILGRTYAIRLADASAPDVPFTASASVQDYGVPVTIFANAYASFVAVPAFIRVEPVSTSGPQSTSIRCAMLSRAGISVHASKAVTGLASTPRAAHHSNAPSTYGVVPPAAIPSTASCRVNASASNSGTAPHGSSSFDSELTRSAASPPAMIPITRPGGN
jgi:hypothetical protein